MRVLEVTICTLLAVIATTPLRSDFDGEMDQGMPQRHSFPHPGVSLNSFVQFIKYGTKCVIIHNS